MQSEGNRASIDKYACDFDAIFFNNSYGINPYSYGPGELENKLEGQRK